MGQPRGSLVALLSPRESQIRIRARRATRLRLIDSLPRVIEKE